ncbi:putative serpin-Z5 [Hordeum vulgare]|uniref:Serpin domain-containing protein n=1 Tax=Hordeum vulgare subsp. vulgare TaxID=112509 RepID=A0A8I6WPT9_HORVV|nr:putative serpin-Z6A [Hordeum vulgare subsp. vulgare]KAE8787953.1 putative serpin-Z5 [Hordeum vulgare]KAI5005248.1 hypothetical protein ZWY2020_032491 [Hordeum vulgare]
MKTSTTPLACPGLTAFALRLINELSSTTATGNLVFSPLSIYTALALTSAGARGATLQELLALLGAKSRKDLAKIVRGLSEQALADRTPGGGPRVSFACGVWHDETRKLKPAFRDAVAQSYKAETGAVDFREKPGEAVKQINAWAAAATNNLIDSVLTEKQVSPETDVVVANAIYFKAMWARRFRESNTKDDKFYRLDGTTLDVPFMRTGKKQDIACHDGFKVLKLEYRQGHVWSSPPSSFSMFIFLPDERDGLRGLVERIASSPDFIHTHLSTSLVSVGDFKLPRFKLTFSADVSDILRRLGHHVAEADMSNMMEEDGTGRPLALSGIVHRAVIEVNEDGTEAAAVTAGIMCGCAAPPKTPPVVVDFVADHPFAFFVIEEESGAIVFAGNVVEPSPSIPGENLRRRDSIRGPIFGWRTAEHPWTSGAIEQPPGIMNVRPFVPHEAALCNPILLFGCVCLVVAFFLQLVRLLVK